MLIVSTPSPDDPWRCFDFKYLSPSYGSYRRHPLSSRVRRHTRSCILQRNCTAQAWYRFCLFFAVHQTENPGYPGRQALACTHAICEAQAQVYSSVWLFARCITISFSFHAPCWLSGWSISLTYFRDACGGPLAGPLLAVQLAVDPWSLRVVAVLDPGFSPHDPNASFYPAKPRVSHWLSLIGLTLLGTTERFQLETSQPQTEL